MNSTAGQSLHPGSVFRTRAWVQAWIDTWGGHPQVRLIDLGGRGDPLEQVYLSRQYVKKFIPMDLLLLAGVGCATVSTPRAEYIDLDSLIHLAGSAEDLATLLKPLRWQRFVVPDVIHASHTPQELRCIAEQIGCAIHQEAGELAYRVLPQPWNDYVANLGSNTRLAYINRRKHLLSLGKVEHESWPLERADQFFALLNQFHELRWQKPCFSAQSQGFLKNLGARLADERGQLLLQLLRVNGDIVAVLLDIEWNGTRYNLQSGFFAERFPKVALGSVHMGYDIEAAMQAGLSYDFMAGQGKHSNYKERIATDTRTIASYYLERGIIKHVRQLKQRIFTSGHPA